MFKCPIKRIDNTKHLFYNMIVNEQKKEVTIHNMKNTDDQEKISILIEILKTLAEVSRLKEEEA